MKKLFKIFVVLNTALLCSCTDLDERLYSVIPEEGYGVTEEEMNSLIGPAYGTMVSYVSSDFWMAEISTDEYMIPSRGLDWYSGGIHHRYHRHEWTANECPNMWKFESITTINKIISMLDNTTVQMVGKERIYAELRGVRAFWYWYMLDAIGNIPIVTKYEQVLPTTQPRAEVYKFVESELLAVVNDLTEDVNGKTYTKFTKWTAYTLLAKLYINAEVYTGKADWENALKYCNLVIEGAKYQLEPDVRNNFLIKNEGSKENIWAIPYDADYFRGYFIPYQMSWHYASKATYSFRSDCWNGPTAVPGFVKKYDKDDIRLKWFMVGQQYDAAGNKLVDTDGSDLIITVDMRDMVDAGRFEGARLFKWEPEVGGRNHLNNDFAVFRYSDILLMKAECLLRISAANEPEARALVNQVRSRNFANYTADKQIAQLTLQNLLDERGYEFVFEGWRRNDQIRFGTFGGTWDFKPNADASTNTLLFPVPLAEMDKNPNLKQNPGY